MEFAAANAPEYPFIRATCGLPNPFMLIGVDSWLMMSALFQKEIHAVEVDDRMTIVERIDSQNTADSGAALLQREMW